MTPYLVVMKTPDLTQEDLPPDVYLLPGLYRNPLHAKAQATQAAVTSEGKMLFSRKLSSINKDFAKRKWPTHVLPHIKGIALFLPLHGTLWNQGVRSAYRESKGLATRNYEAELQMMAVAPLMVEEYPLPNQVKYEVLKWLTRFNTGSDPVLPEFHDWARGVEEPTHAYRRLGQRNFRNRVFSLLGNRCVLTGHTANVEACHIQPYSKCSDPFARMNPYNGIPLSPSPHKLFDSRKMSFSVEGKPIRSYRLPVEELTSVGIDLTISVPFSEDHFKFINWHRENAFDGELDPETFDIMSYFP